MKMDEMFEEPFGDYVWCLHCEKVHTKESWEKNDCECPACNAGLFDAWHWERLLDSHPDYPEVPEEGKEYPLY